MRLRILSLAVLGVLCVTLVAADEAAREPRSAPAVKALQKHEQAMKAADAAWLKAALEAQRTLIAELEAAKSQAMEAKQLEEANAIHAAIEDAKRELDALMGKVQAKTVEVIAGQGWADVATVKSGQRIRFAASGEWCANTSNRAKWTFGPDGGVIDGIRYGLVGSIGDREFFIGKGTLVTVRENGLLRLRLEGGGTSNDDGSVKVAISSP